MTKRTIIGSIALGLLVTVVVGCEESNKTTTAASGGSPSSGGAASAIGGASFTGATGAGAAASGTGGTGTGATGTGATGTGATGTGGAGAAGGTGGTAAGGTTTGGTAAGGTGVGGDATGGTAAGGTATGGTGTGLGGDATGGTAAGGTATGGTGGGDGGADTATGGSTTDGGATGTGGDTGACPTVSEFETWDSGKSPTDIGKAAVENFKPRTGEAYGGDGYAWTFGYVGSLQFTQTIGDTTNNESLISNFDCSQQGPDNGTSASVDTRAFGDLPLEIFLENDSAACKTLGLARADAQWTNTTSDGITTDARYWIDDMYMITSLQVFAYRATKDTKYLDRTAKTMLAYIAELQKNNDTTTDGLFWHTKQSKAYWGRANGWVASGMTELLLELPAGTDRDQIMAAYKRQMDGLLQHQITSGTDVGAWRQVVDRSDAKPEMSCTAMFTFALVTGVKNGWLTDAKYITAAVSGWKALATRTSSGMLDQVCPGTGQADAGDIASQQKFYMDIAFQANDRHGQGPELWAATALLRKDCPGKR